MINKALKILQTEGPPTQACVMLVPESQHVEGENKMKWGKTSEGHNLLDPGSLQQPPEMSDATSMGYTIQKQTKTFKQKNFKFWFKVLAVSSTRYLT